MLIGERQRPVNNLGVIPYFKQPLQRTSVLQVRHRAYAVRSQARQGSGAGAKSAGSTQHADDSVVVDTFVKQVTLCTLRGLAQFGWRVVIFARGHCGCTGRVDTDQCALLRWNLFKESKPVTPSKCTVQYCVSLLGPFGLLDGRGEIPESSSNIERPGEMVQMLVDGAYIRLVQTRHSKCANTKGRTLVELAELSQLSAAQDE